MSRRSLPALVLAASLGLPLTAFAKDKIKVAAPHPTLLATTISSLAKSFGYFDKHDLDVELLWTAGGADAQQSVVNGSTDIAVQTGMAGILSAIQRGAPIAIVAAETTGAPDVVWVVRSDRPWKSLAELDASNTASFSRPGSSSDFTLRTLLDHYKSKARAIPSGSPPETLVMVMTGQIDAAYGVPPLPREVAEGKLRIIARGNDAPKLKGLTVRVHAVNTTFLEKNRDAVRRFLAAWKQTLDALYADAAVQAKAAELVKITPDEVRAIIRDFMPRESTVMDRIGDLEQAIEQGIVNKQLRGPLTDAQKAAVHKLVAEMNAR